MTFHSDYEIHEFFNQFEACTLPEKKFTHQAHLVVATTYLTKFDKKTATNKIREAIKSFNVANGAENTDMGGYHETITIFYMESVAQLLKQVNAGFSLKEKVQAILHSSLVDTSYVFNFYSKDYLFTVKARREFVEPDLRNFVL